MVQSALKKLKAIWQAAGWPLRIAAVVFVAVVVGYGVFAIVEAIHARRYEKQLQRLEQRATDAERKANEQLQFADEAHAKAEMLEMKIKEVSQQLLEANAQLQDAHSRSQAAKVIYVKAKENPQPQYLTGNASIDSRLLCEKLRADGFPCR